MTLLLMIAGIVVAVASVFTFLVAIDNESWVLGILAALGFIAGFAMVISAVVIDNENFYEACMDAGGSAVIEQYGDDLCIDSDGRLIPVP